MKHYLCLAMLLIALFGLNSKVCGAEPQSGFRLIVLGDTQPQTEEQITRLECEILPQIESIVAEYKAADERPVALLITGDVVWDTMEFLPRIKQMFSSLGVPLYTVIGNHDFDRSVVGDEPLARRHYEAVFGPRYYIAQLGDTPLIALDNIDYSSYDDYTIGVDREQRRWLRKVLRDYPKDGQVVVAMHAPVVNYRTGKVLRYARQLLRLFGKREVHFITGHRHRHATADITPRIIEHSVAQVNGNLWFAPLCADGTPRGVFCIDERDGEWRWHHRTFTTEPLNPLVVWDEKSLPEMEEYVVVKVIGWDEKWSVEWRENGERRGAMEQVTMVDPDYVRYVEQEAEYNEIIMQRLRRSAIPQCHYFRCRRTESNSQITIVATDRFGTSHSATTSL
mgnify:CR=1 FL=1